MKSKNARILLTGMSCTLILSAGILWFAHQGRSDKTLSDAEYLGVRQLQGKRSLIFIENRGQWDEHVAFMARRPGMIAWLQKDGVTFQFEKREERNKAKGVVVSMSFEDASEQVLLGGEQRQTANYSFFIGHDRSKWRSDVAGHAKVMYHRLYRGIDLCFREDNGWLEYDLLLSQDADVRDVVIRCEGLKELRIDEKGTLVMETEYGPISQNPPKAWYESNSGKRIPVVCNFRKIDAQRYGFSVPDADVDMALIIDPGLEWSTFLGGVSNDRGISLDFNSLGYIIITGSTESPNFPTTYGAYDTTFVGGPNDGFVSCFNPDGSQLLWSTFLGGSGVDALFEVELDDSDKVVVGGLTTSPDFPTTASAYDTMHNGTFDGVIACLSPDGSQLLYSTYLGTANEDMIVALTVSNSGDAIVCGYTESPNFPTTPGAYDDTYNGGVRDAFVTRISADGTALIYSTFLGGSNDDGWYYHYPFIEETDNMMLVLDNADNVIIGGTTQSSDFPTTSGAYDMTFNGSWDAFITKLDATGSNLIYSTYLGGSAVEGPYLNAISLSENGMVALGGFTTSSDFPTTPNAFDTTYNGGADDWDAYVSILDSTGSQLLYSTFIGGTGPQVGDVVCGMAFDANGDLLICGQAEYGFPVTPGAYDTTIGGNWDAYVARISPDSNGQADLVYSSFLGGINSDMADDLALLDDSTVVLSGITWSANFPTTSGAYDEIHNGLCDVFVCQFGVYTGIDENSTDKPFNSMLLSSVFPNPSDNTFSYSVNLSNTQEVKVSIYDAAGRHIQTLIDRELRAGTHTFSWRPAKELANGTYFLKLQAGVYRATEKLLLIR